MTRRCMVTGKGPITGNHVSHAKNRVKRRFMANVKDASLYSEVLKSWVSMRISASGLRTVEHKGGLDAYLTGTASTKLPEALRPVRARIMKVLAAAK